MTPECYQKLETLRLSVETIKAALETAEVQKTKTDHIKFMNIVRKELKALHHIIEYIKADMNAQAMGRTSIEEPKREAAPPSSFWSTLFQGHFWSLS